MFQAGLDLKFGEYVLHEEEGCMRKPKEEPVSPPDSADRSYTLCANYKSKKRGGEGQDATAESTSTVISVFSTIHSIFSNSRSIFRWISITGSGGG